MAQRPDFTAMHSDMSYAKSPQGERKVLAGASAVSLCGTGVLCSAIDDLTRHSPGDGPRYANRRSSRVSASQALVWRIVVTDAKSLGLIMVSPPPSIQNSAFRYYGPVLTPLLNPDPDLCLESAAAISLVCEWLGEARLAHVVHANHAPDDTIGAQWLEEAGFIYTGLDHDLPATSPCRMNREMIRLC